MISFGVFKQCKIYREKVGGDLDFFGIFYVIYVIDIKFRWLCK